MTNSTFIRLAGPLQSWAALSITGNFVRTERTPTDTALKGLLAGALGFRRGQWASWVEDVSFTVREDANSSVVSDFQTIGSREDEFEFRKRLGIMQQMKAAKSIGQLSFKPAVGATAISRRTYLVDGEFIVRVTHPEHVEEIDQALSSPAFSTYLGRKAFPASFPFYLGTGNSDLLSQIPVVAPKAKDPKSSVLIHETALPTGVTPATEWVPAVNDRKEWIEAIQRLPLHRHKTIL